MLRPSLSRPGLSGWCALTLMLLVAGRQLAGLEGPVDGLLSRLYVVPEGWPTATLLGLALLALAFHLVRLSLLLACTALLAVLLAGTAAGEASGQLAPLTWHLVLLGHLLLARVLPIRAARRGLTSLPTLWVAVGTAALALTAEAGPARSLLMQPIPWLADHRPLTAGLAAVLILGTWLGRRRGNQRATVVLAFTLGVCLVLLIGQLPGLSSVPWAVLLAAVAVVVLLESLYGLAYLDELTGVPSRRALDDALRSPSRRYAVALVDVDHFKKINDRHGHDAGDQVLRAIARRLSSVRGADVYRYGGEEFVLLFRGRDRDEAAEEVDRLRKAVAAKPFIVRRSQNKTGTSSERNLRVRFSSGIADQRSGPPAASILEAADKALYRAKRAGRNRVIVAKR